MLIFTLFVLVSIHILNKINIRAMTKIVVNDIKKIITSRSHPSKLNYTCKMNNKKTKTREKQKKALNKYFF